MKKVFLFVCILFSLVSSAQTTDWVKSFGGVESDKGISIGVDSLGYVYCSGWYNTEATFGNITLTLPRIASFSDSSTSPSAKNETHTKA